MPDTPSPTWQLVSTPTPPPGALDHFLTHARSAFKRPTYPAQPHAYPAATIILHDRFPTPAAYKRRWPTRSGTKLRRTNPYKPFSAARPSLAYHYSSFFDPLK